MTQGHASISREILERYAADAAMEVEGVRALAGRRSIRIDNGRVELHLCVEWSASIPDVGREVQVRVHEYLERMAGLVPTAVDVVVDEFGPAS